MPSSTACAHLLALQATQQVTMFPILYAALATAPVSNLTPRSKPLVPCTDRSDRTRVDFARATD